MTIPILINDLANSTYCFNEKKRLNPSMGLILLRSGSSDSKDTKNPVWIASTIIASTKEMTNKGAIIIKKEMVTCIKRYPTASALNGWEICSNEYRIMMDSRFHMNSALYFKV